jgi:hypothetical protein
LDLHRRSAVLGEKGFGLGVCGTWTSLDEALRAADLGNAAAGGNATLTPGQDQSS